MLSLGCVDDLIFETKTVGVGDDVTLTCTRQKSEFSTVLFWTRLVSGSLPEVLGATFTFDDDGANNIPNKIPHITVKQEPETFVLHINKTKISDSGFYNCIKAYLRDMRFLNGTFLRIKGKHHLNLHVYIKTQIYNC